jgi:hypothetical protein
MWDDLVEAALSVVGDATADSEARRVRRVVVIAVLVLAVVAAGVTVYLVA